METKYIDKISYKTSIAWDRHHGEVKLFFESNDVKIYFKNGRIIEVPVIIDDWKIYIDNQYIISKSYSILSDEKRQEKNNEMKKKYNLTNNEFNEINEILNYGINDKIHKILDEIYELYKGKGVEISKDDIDKIQIY